MCTLFSLVRHNTPKSIYIFDYICYWMIFQLWWTLSHLSGVCCYFFLYLVLLLARMHSPCFARHSPYRYKYIYNILAKYVRCIFKRGVNGLLMNKRGKDVVAFLFSYVICTAQIAAIEFNVKQRPLMNALLAHDLPHALRYIHKTLIHAHARTRHTSTPPCKIKAHIHTNHKTQVRAHKHMHKHAKHMPTHAYV